MAEARDAGVDQPAVERLEALVIDAEPEFHVGTIVLDDNVRGPDHSAKNLGAFRLLEIEGDAALVAVQILKIRSVARPAHVAALDSLRQLDLDDVGAPVRKLAHARRAGADAGQIQHFEAGERFAGGKASHGLLLGNGRMRKAVHTIGAIWLGSSSSQADSPTP